jgi:hypothetical protein
VYRYRQYVVVKYGQFRQYKELFDQGNALCEKKGWTKATTWVPVGGESNAFVIENDYPDLASYERETDQMYSDAEVMGLWRQSAALIIEGSSREELLASAPDIA